MVKIKGREMQIQGQYTMCYRRGNRTLGVKPLHRPQSGK